MRTLSFSLVATLLGAAALAQDRTFEQSVPAEPNGVVTVSNVAGRVAVTGWERPEVAVSARLDRDIERVEVTSQRGRTLVRVILPERGSRRGGEADLEVRVPRGSELEVTTVSADIHSRGVLGVQRLRSVSGDIDADMAAADVELKTVSGDAVLRGRDEPATVRATTVSGDFTLDRGAGTLEVTTVSGDVLANLGAVRSVRLRTTSGDVSFRGRLAQDATLDAETVSGELQLRTPAESGFSYEVSTFSGDIESCFGAQPERTSKYGPGSRLSGRQGKGSASVRVRSMSGEVSICDR